ncbi:MAG: fluoride efflux transporter CrcB [Bacillota bacterium]|nr:fluoride efflux transporter CrcB [Bacillota bacterium]
MLFVGIGGILGAITRFLLGKWVANKISSTIPLGTWFINISGSFLLGILAILHVRNSIQDWQWLLMGTGFFGAYTTFSTFGFETIQMLQSKKNKLAFIYVSTSVFLGVFFAWIGSLLGKMLS